MLLSSWIRKGVWRSKIIANTVLSGLPKTSRIAGLMRIISSGEDVGESWKFETFSFVVVLDHRWSRRRRVGSIRTRSYAPDASWTSITCHASATGSGQWLVDLRVNGLQPSTTHHTPCRKYHLNFSLTLYFSVSLYSRISVQDFHLHVYKLVKPPLSNLDKITSITNLKSDDNAGRGIKIYCTATS